MADSPRGHPVYGDLAPAHPSGFLRLVDAESARQQEQILAEVMRLPSNRGDHAYQVAARRVRALGRPSRLLTSFYEEILAYYLRRPRLSSMRSSYRSRMKARRRRG